QYGTKRVLIAYDRDDAGDAAAAKLAEKLLAEGIGVSRIQFPRGMDANEYALKVAPPEKSLGLAIRSAEWIGLGASGVQTETINTLPTEAAPSLAADEVRLDEERPPLTPMPDLPSDVPV